MQEADEQSEGKNRAWSAGGELERCERGEWARAPVWFILLMSVNSV